MILNNEEIVFYFTQLDSFLFSDSGQLTKYYSPKVNYAISRNIATLASIVSIINTNRQDIYNHYGTVTHNEDGNATFKFDNNVLGKVNSDLEELAFIENDVNIISISLEDIESLDLSLKQMEALMFMIKEKKESKIMKMTNFEIYNIAKAMTEAFQDGTQYLPVKVNFFIQKNKATLMALAQDIDNSRVEIVKNYGIMDETTNQFTVPEDKIEIANAELMDLFNIEQEVDVRKVSIDAFPDDINLNTAQMEALMFMID